MTRLTQFAIASLLGGLIVSSTAGARPVVELHVWGLFAESHPYGAAMIRLTEAFSRKNPDIRVTYEGVAGLSDKLQVAIASGTGPDVSIVAGGVLPNRADLPRLLIPLTPYYERDGVEEAFVPGSLNWFSWEGISYAAPLSLDFNFPLVINNDMFQSAGIDYTDVDSIDALWDVSFALTRFGPDGEVQVAAMRPWDLYGYHQGLITWVRAFGGQLSDGKRYTLDNPEVGEALRWLLAYADTFGRTQMPNDPARVAMTPAVLSQIRTHAEGAHVQTDLRLLPFPSARPGAPSIWLGGQWLAITAISDHPDEAWEFVRWVTLSTEAAELSRGAFISGALAPHREGIYLLNPVSKFDHLQNEYMRLVQHVGVLEHPTMYFWSELESMVQRVVIDASLPVEGAQQEYNETLNARLVPLLDSSRAQRRGLSDNVALVKETRSP